MFKWLNKQGVESKKGFVLQGMHRFYYHYIEGDKTMQIIVEPFTNTDGQYFETISVESLRQWLPPHQDITIDAQKEREIRENVSDALDFMGIKHQFTDRG